MSEKNKKQTAEIIDPGLGELDKVRNILFGRQVKDYEKRFAELESSLNDMITKISNTVEKRMDQLEVDFNERETILKESLQNTGNDFSEKLSDFQSDMDNISAVIGTDLAQMKGELRAELATENDQLSSDKTDRESLAMMFDEMSMRLRNKDNS